MSYTWTGLISRIELLGLIELHRVNQDVNILEISQTYSSRASKVSYLRNEVTLRASLLGTSPVGLPKTKMPKEYSKPTRASE